MSASVKLITKQVKTTGAWALEIEETFFSTYSHLRPLEFLEFFNLFLKFQIIVNGNIEKKELKTLHVQFKMQPFWKTHVIM